MHDLLPSARRHGSARVSLADTLDAQAEAPAAKPPAGRIRPPTPSVPALSRSRDDKVADPLTGLVVADRYRIVQQLGRGGMGIVYKVEHTHIGKLLAMKVLAGELSMNKEVVRRFKHEALTVSKLSSRHTVQVFDYGVWQHLTYLVMELVEGRDMARALRRDGPMVFARLGKLMVQVCASLAEAHDKGIVHRDVKPENIMIIPDVGGIEIAKVLDFGLAKLREGPDLNAMTSQGAVVGTPYCISPEQVMGDEVDGRSDIYSLGAVMFRALTGSYPFAARTPMAMFNKHLTAPPPSATERAPELNIPRHVSELVQRCMQKEPGERLQTAHQLRAALVEQLNAIGLPSSDRLLLGDGMVHEGAPTIRRSRWRSSRAGVATDSSRDQTARSQIATRNEMAAYERKLRRTKYWTRALAVAVLGGAVLAVVLVLGIGWQRFTARPFTGRELEPNNQVAQANPLPVGSAVEAHLGRRLDPDRGDQDFFAFDVPQGGAEERYLSLRLDALPNLAACVLLYREGFSRPWAQFCTGSAGQDLLVPAVRIVPGRHFVGVIQDRDPYGDSQRPFIHENVSDAYRLVVNLVEPAARDEVEPNDEIQTSLRLTRSQMVDGTLGWMGDEDVVCATDVDDVPVRWQVEDGDRKPGTVLEVTPLQDGEAGSLVRVHGPAAEPFGHRRLEADVNSPWVSPWYEGGAGLRCLRLRLAVDPWVDTRPTGLPRPDETRYTVTVLAK